MDFEPGGCVGYEVVVEGDSPRREEKDDGRTAELKIALFSTAGTGAGRVGLDDAGDVEGPYFDAGDSAEMRGIELADGAAVAVEDIRHPLERQGVDRVVAAGDHRRRGGLAIGGEVEAVVVVGRQPHDEGRAAAIGRGIDDFAKSESTVKAQLLTGRRSTGSSLG